MYDTQLAEKENRKKKEYQAKRQQQQQQQQEAVSAPSGSENISLPSSQQPETEQEDHPITTLSPSAKSFFFLVIS